MLKLVTITVEESTAEHAIDALNRYERNLHAAESDRFDLDDSGDDCVGWLDGPDVGRLDEELGRTLIFEDVCFDPGGPSYVGTRTISLTRLDTRD